MAYHQLRQQADAQTLGYHGQNGAVLPRGVFHVGADAHFVKGGHDLVVLALLQLDIGLGGQGVQWEGGGVGQGMMGRQDHLQLILMQRIDLQFLHGGQPQKAAVHRAAKDPLLNLVIKVAGDYLKLNIGIKPAEALQDGGQPVDGDAGEGGHFYQTAVHAPQAGGGLGQGVVVGAQLLDLGQQGAAIRRQHHAAPIAAEQRHPQLVLQRLYCMADAGLGKVQRLGRLGKIAAAGGFQEDLILGNAHGPPPL